MLVDTKLPGFGAGILEQVRSVTAKPITMIINTHTHADHTGGNPELPRNVEHIAQQNTRGNMAKMDLFKAANEGLLPTRTFTDRLSLLSGADRIDLYYFGPGHTNGDAIVVFPALRVAATGDLFARKWAPLVDAPHGRTASPNTNNQHKSHAGHKDLHHRPCDDADRARRDVHFVQPALEVERSAGIRGVYPRIDRRRARRQSGRQDRRRSARRAETA